MKNILFLFFVCCIVPLTAQNVGYQKPDKAILDLVDVPLAPGVLMDDAREYMVLTYRDAYKSIEDLSRQEMRLGGLRIDPATNIGSRTTYSNKIAVRRVTGETELMEVMGLPDKPKLSNFTWSPDQTKVAMTHTTPIGVEVWFLDVAAASVKRVTSASISPVNANLGDVINWFEDGQSMLLKFLPANREELINGATAVPTGPTISTADGKKAQNRTYQDLLKNPNDEHNFEQLARSAIVKVRLDGSGDEFLPTDMYRGVSFSPDGEYVMVTAIERPFSYLVPYSRFPSVTTVYTKDGKKVSTINTVPLIEDLPKGFMATQPGRRSISWRSDRAASLIYVEALDEGDPANEVEFRDQVFTLLAPFSGKGTPLVKTINRFAGVQWGDDKTAIIYDRWWDTRNTKTYVFNPSDPSKKARIISDRNYQDSYNDPGNFVSKRNEWGSSVLAMKNGYAFLLGDG
ncbi:MAG: S9 family peptidase, partial [Lewinella sp.]|nr:S9 family peptidase [Lewinella sp.]